MICIITQIIWLYVVPFDSTSGYESHVVSKRIVYDVILAIIVIRTGKIQTTAIVISAI